MRGEAIETFECFGGRCQVRVADPHAEIAARAAREARLTLLDAHRTLSRFDAGSELSRLNRDRRREVPASALLRRVASAALEAGLRSGGLVDATLVAEIEAAGYDEARDFDARAVRDGPTSPLRPGAPSPRAGWCALVVDDAAGTVARPPGLRLDPGGIAKGLLADLVGESLAGFDSFAVDCCGDLRVGGTGGEERRVLVDDPVGGEPLHVLRIVAGAVATSGITRRAWTGDDGRRAHQIIDPASGRPAFTGIVQATAIAPTGLLAETLAKSALLSGPDRAELWLPFGGVVVEEGGAMRVIDPLPALLPEVLAA
ncbi:MAG TPA: FAD:protein FMN transferase [Solirubrobacterales bacterium]|nr:FAD:protein FMN transferase [Solirubrobacterales bacterium]